MSVQGQPAGGPDIFAVTDVVELRLPRSPAMIVIRVWLVEFNPELDNDPGAFDTRDGVMYRQWCLCCWFSDKRELCEREFPASLLRRASVTT